MRTLVALSFSLMLSFSLWAYTQTDFQVSGKKNAEPSNSVSNPANKGIKSSTSKKPLITTEPINVKDTTTVNLPTNIIKPESISPNFLRLFFPF